VSDYDGAVQALVRAYIACRLAIDALPELPDEIRKQVTEPITVLCDIVGKALDGHQPGVLGDTALPSD
jgi:hypothetical protein